MVDCRAPWWEALQKGIFPNPPYDHVGFVGSSHFKMFISLVSIYYRMNKADGKLVQFVGIICILNERYLPYVAAATKQFPLWYSCRQS